MSQKNNMLSALIIGCGNIAGKFDMHRLANASPLTHAGAYSEHGGFQLKACVDPDAICREEFKNFWHIDDAFADLSDVHAEPGTFDVISLCSPTDLHASHLEGAIKLKPRLIFCEKPVTTEAKLTRLWADRASASGILLAINHTRRWAPDIVRLRQQLASGEWGMVRSVIGIYNKGILNNGSHMIDLLRYLFGELEFASAGHPIWDYWEDDPSINATVTTKDGIVCQLIASHAHDYALFELQIVTAAGVISMEDGGAMWRIRRSQQSTIFAGYHSLDQGEMVKGEYMQSMTNAVDNIYEALENDMPLASDGNSAFEAQRLCEEIAANALQIQTNFPRN